MTVEVLLDTSYLISLVDANRPNHQTAAKYYRQMLNESLPMYFSAVAAVHAPQSIAVGPGGELFIGSADGAGLQTVSAEEIR